MKKILFAVACSALVLVSCNKKSKEIDQNIDKFETLVNEYCSALESGDMAAAEATTAKFQEVAEALKDSTAMSQEQKDRLKALGMKMAEASMSVLNNAAEALDDATDTLDEAAEVLDEAAAELDEAAEAVEE